MSVTKTKKPLTSFTIKLTDADLLALKRRAEKFARGNLSAWLRNAGLSYAPGDKPVKEYPHPKRPAVKTQKG